MTIHGLSNYFHGLHLYSPLHFEHIMSLLFILILVIYVMNSQNQIEN